jgi:hypothetical protein
VPLQVGGAGLGELTRDPTHPHHGQAGSGLHRPGQRVEHASLAAEHLGNAIRGVLGAVARLQDL